MLEIGVERVCYSLILWWEVRPVMRVLSAERRGKNSGDAVGGVEDARLETHLRSDGTRERQWAGVLWALSRGPNGSGLGTQEGLLGRLSPTGPHRGFDLGVRPDGLDSPKVGPTSSGPSSSEGPSSLKGLRSMESIKSGGLYGREDCHDPSGVALPLVWAGPSQLKESDAEGFPFWDYDGGGGNQGPTALIEEASRYGCVPIPCGLMASGLSPSSLFFFGRTPLGDFCDISRDDRVTHLRETHLRRAQRCKESSGKELRLAQSMPRDGKGWEEESWEESELAKFSKFLGFSTEGLEKEILEFMIKIRKRREKVHSKNLLEKSKFERELKRLECSINYEGGKKQKSEMIVGGVRLCNDRGLVRSLGRFLNCRTLDAQDLGNNGNGSGSFSISCRMRNVEDGLVRMFLGVYGPFSKEEREWMWEEIRAIRGIWENPWCIGVTSILTSAMRRFAQVVDELELIDLPLQGGIDDFSDLLRGWWRGVEVRGGPLWDREVFGRLEANKNSPQQVDFGTG
ncbi:hypothetical protein AAG906_038643 [Vitis piasezkii]